jgi:hypothetical protein
VDDSDVRSPMDGSRRSWRRSGTVDRPAVIYVFSTRTERAAAVNRSRASRRASDYVTSGQRGSVLAAGSSVRDDVIRASAAWRGAGRAPPRPRCPRRRAAPAARRALPRAAPVERTRGRRMDLGRDRRSTGGRTRWRSIRGLRLDYPRAGGDRAAHAPCSPSCSPTASPRGRSSACARRRRRALVPAPCGSRGDYHMGFTKREPRS